GPWRQPRSQACAGGLFARHFPLALRLRLARAVVLSRPAHGAPSRRIAREPELAENHHETPVRGAVRYRVRRGHQALRHRPTSWPAEHLDYRGDDPRL